MSRYPIITRSAFTVPAGNRPFFQKYASMPDDRSEHYYAAQPTSLSQPVIYEDTLRGIPLKLWTDRGVFSRGHTDLGSRELIKAMELAGARRILDLGCGYGVIGIAAAKLAPEAHVILTDPNERAVKLARQNLETNVVHNAEVRQGEGFDPVADEQFDVVLTNPPIRAGNAVVFSLIAAAAAHLPSGGRLYLVARTKQGARTFAKEMEKHFATVTQAGQGSGYRVYEGVK
ncbi:MAG: Ribosomal RNA small subunit methyltransferase C [bacterium ADurb.Bin429]|nr:MAG: Ribosomal RNA small subunit methyltransferase C [bacterium ADurb.Bin429]